MLRLVGFHIMLWLLADSKVANGYLDEDVVHCNQFFWQVSKGIWLICCNVFDFYNWLVTPVAYVQAFNLSSKIRLCCSWVGFPSEGSTLFCDIHFPESNGCVVCWVQSQVVDSIQLGAHFSFSKKLNSWIWALWHSKTLGKTKPSGGLLFFLVVFPDKFSLYVGLSMPSA